MSRSHLADRAQAAHEHGVTGPLRGPVPGQLCLLELLDQSNSPNVPDVPNRDGVGSGGAAALAEWEWAVLSSRPSTI